MPLNWLLGFAAAAGATMLLAVLIYLIWLMFCPPIEPELPDDDDQ